MTDDAEQRLAQWAAEQTCPQCGHETLRLVWRFEAKQLGTFSVSGHSMKASATRVPWLVCSTCGASGRGKRS